MSMEFLAQLTLLLPLLGAICGALMGYSLPENKRHRPVELLTTGCVSVTAMCALILFVNIGFLGGSPITSDLFTWLSFEHFSAQFGVLVDKLTATMLVVVTLVSACVHVYSLGYMHEDKGRARFFIYLSLFTFTMLALVTAPNLLQMFLGWEGVGVCSYLLIGFWHQKESANAAAMKAFVVNRIADAALLLGMFLLVFTFGTLDYAGILPVAGNKVDNIIHFLGHDWRILDITALLLFIGAMGKSAQIGLHVWLPDAMEGPTPVSALIHAATMVTAGVFLMCRMSPLLEYSPFTLEIITWVGGLTALFAATIGLTQSDIKRVIAYSTCSQLGYMFFAIGVSAYPAAMFHLTTHAFFKALLFLGAGSVIHGLHHEQDLFKMGGIKHILIITYVLMWIGSLALVGIPPFAGFFSKDLIIESAFGAHTNSGYIVAFMGVVAAALTAFYSFRLLFLAFHGGSCRATKNAAEQAHESPMVMLAPMAVLAVGAVLCGFILKDMGYIEWWQGALFIADHNHALHNAHHTAWYLKLIPLIVAVGGIIAAWYVYIKKPGSACTLIDSTGGTQGGFYALSFNKWYVDELYQYVFVNNYRRLARFLWRTGDEGVIDYYGPNGAVRYVTALGNKIRRGQTGYVFHYAFVFVIGVVGLTLWLMVK